MSNILALTKFSNRSFFISNILQLNVQPDESIVLTDQSGLPILKGEWAELKKRIDATFKSYSDDDLEEGCKEAASIWQNRRASIASRKSIQPGTIYLIKGNEQYKIGKTKNFTERMKWFGIKLPFPVEIVHTFNTDDTARAESELHGRFSEKRLHGEWFALTDQDVAETKAIQTM